MNRAQFDEQPRTVNDLCDLLQVEYARLAKLVRRIDNGYSPFHLTTGSKRRTIHRPQPWLKSLQRDVLDQVLSRYAVSGAVYSQRGRGVIENARQHLDRSYMAVLDVQDCFPSTRLYMVRDAFDRLGLNETAVRLLSRIVTYQDMLPQGPPSSPAVLNLVFAPVDETLTRLASKYGAIYTRYMDDLAFSSDTPLNGLIRDAEKVIRSSCYRVNMRKRRLWGPEDRHTVTKIVVTSTLNPEPEYLSALAEEIKKSRMGSSSLTFNQLAGRIAWIQALDPALGQRLRRSLSRSQVVA